MPGLTEGVITVFTQKQPKNNFSGTTWMKLCQSGVACLALAKSCRHHMS